jgi:outer membrane receptor for ferrienterochelin and colicins
MKIQLSLFFFFGLFLSGWSQGVERTLMEIELIGRDTSAPPPVPTMQYQSETLTRTGAVDVAGMFQRIPGMGVQLTCGVCHTADIRLRGTEGPHTLLSIAGIPVFGPLASVYGWMGIPAGMVDRIEVTSGPQRVVYGPGGMGGMVDIYPTVGKPNRPFGIKWVGDANGRHTVDVFAAGLLGKQTTHQTGVQLEGGFFSQDRNKDGYHDYPHLARIGAFTHIFKQAKGHDFRMVGRIFGEERWAGQQGFRPTDRGSTTLYGEWAQTLRAEWLMSVEKKTWRIRGGSSFHYQDAWYGLTRYTAVQPVVFAQTDWNIRLGKSHRLRPGLSIQYQGYDDHTPATAQGLTHALLAGPYLEYETKVVPNMDVIAGFRLDGDPNHGWIPTPRLHAKYQLHPQHALQFGGGSAFRVVSLFTEDHAALSGFRTVVIPNTLNPERSWSAVLRYTGQLKLRKGWLTLTAEGFYHRFSNRILPDYDTDPNLIIYVNDTTGVRLMGGLIGGSWQWGKWEGMVSTQYVNASRNQEIAEGNIYHTPEWQGDARLSRRFFKGKLWVEWSTRWVGPMRLPLQEMDPRPRYSPWFALSDVAFSWKIKESIALGGGIRNLFDYVPPSPLTRGHDPFDLDANNLVDNPLGLTFDAGYTWAPLMGVTPFISLSFTPTRK